MIKQSIIPEKPVIVDQIKVRSTVLIGLAVMYSMYLVHINRLHFSFSISIGNEQTQILSPVPAGFEPTYTPNPTPTTRPVQNDAPSITPTAKNTSMQGTIPATWADFIAKAREVAVEEDYPLSVLLAQASLESGYGKSGFARERNNYFGICAYTSNPNAACIYNSQEDNIRAYIKLIKYGPRYQVAWSYRSNPYRMAQEIHKAGYATDPDYTQKITNLIAYYADSK